MIRALLKWALFNGFLALHDLREAWRERGHVRQLRSPDYSNLLLALESAGATRLAVVAPHPTRPLVFSLRNLVAALLAEGYEVVVLSCAPKDMAWLPAEFPSVHLAPRNMTGRDFGAWKFLLQSVLGSDTLRSRLDDLILVNDSAFYSRTGTRDVVAWLRGIRKAWACVFETHEIHYHAQSFLLKFSGDAVRNPAFSAFWAGYQPYSSRKHSIGAGEVGLSSVMRAALGLPECYVTPTRMLAALQAADERQILASVRAMEHGFALSGYGFRDVRRALGLAPFANGSYAQSPNYELARRAVSDAAIELMESRNAAHAVGVLANLLMHTPVKRDLCYRGVYRIGQILQLCSGFDAEELQSMEEDLRSMGEPESLTGRRKFLYGVGRI